MEAKMITRKRRTYDREFKRNAVLLCKERGRSVPEVAKNLGINKDLLYRWCREFNNSDGKPVFPGHGIEALTEDQKRIRELEKQLRETEMERDILKKAMAIFSKAPK